MNETPSHIGLPNLPKTNPWEPWIIAIIASAVIFGGAIGLMKVFGLFDVDDPNNRIEALIASVGVVGAFLSAAITLVGIVVKYSIDQRNSQLSAIESIRNHQLSVDTGNRNRIELAIRAVGLLGENNKDTTTHQTGGALLALVSLGEYELAVSLLSTLWPDGLASREVADVVLSKALAEGSDEVKISAATILSGNVERISNEKTYFWPIDEYWRNELPGSCRLSLIYAASEWLISDVQKMDELSPSVIILYRALSDSEVSYIAHANLEIISRYFPSSATVGFDANNSVTIQEIVNKLKEFPKENYSNQSVDFENRLEKALNERFVKSSQ